MRKKRTAEGRRSLNAFPVGYGYCMRVIVRRRQVCAIGVAQRALVHFLTPEDIIIIISSSLPSCSHYTVVQSSYCITTFNVIYGRFYTIFNEFRRMNNAPGSRDRMLCNPLYARRYRRNVWIFSAFLLISPEVGFEGV